MSTVESTPLQGVLVLSTQRLGDERGWFCETFRRDLLAEAGFDRDFVQENASMSARRGTVRGLHFQRPPHAQDKLVRVVAGAIHDVAVDLRAGSATYGQGFGIELSAANGRQLLVPRGFAHGFMTLSEHTVVAYKLSAYYAPEAEGGLLWSDPGLGLAWPLPADEAVLNARDAAWPPLDRFETPFTAQAGAA